MSRTNGRVEASRARGPPWPGSPGRRACRPARRPARGRCGGGTRPSSRRGPGIGSCRAVDALAHALQPVDDEPAALPGGGGQPLGVVGRLRRVEPHDGGDLARRRCRARRAAARCALTPCCGEVARPNATSPPTTSPASGQTTRAPRGNGCGFTRSALPSNAPTQRRRRRRPARSRPAPSGSSAAGHGSGIQTCDQPHSAASADGADQQRRRPRRARAGRAAPAAPPRRLDQQRLDEVEREVRHRLAQHAGRPSATRTRARRGRTATAPSAAAAADPQRARRPAPMPAASAISIGWKTSRNCGTPKSNSAWKVERPIRKRARRATTRPHERAHAALAGRRRSRRAAPPRRAARPARSASSPAPPISIRCVGPHSVTSWPNSRCQTSSSGKPISANAAGGGHQHAAERRVPVRRRAGSRSGDGLLQRERTSTRKPAAKTPNSPTRIR